jgi:acyl carrier protein
MSTLERARRLVAETFDVPATTISDDATFETVERWDSIGHLRLILALEGAIGREVTAEEAASAFSVREIARLLT